MKTYKNILSRALLLVREFGEDESGATAIEYGLIAGLVAVAIIAGLTQLGYDNSERLRCTQRALEGRRLGRRCQAVGVG